MPNSTETAEERSRRVHLEAQKRYLEKLAKRGVAPGAVILRFLGKAMLEASVAQIVNTGGHRPGSALSPERELMIGVLRSAISAMEAAGYSATECHQAIKRMAKAERLKAAAKAAAHDDEAPMAPSPGA